jgi:hypothetical protein
MNAANTRKKGAMKAYGAQVDQPARVLLFRETVKASGYLQAGGRRGPFLGGGESLLRGGIRG